MIPLCVAYFDLSWVTQGKLGEIKDKIKPIDKDKIMWFDLTLL